MIWGENRRSSVVGKDLGSLVEGGKEAACPLLFYLSCASRLDVVHRLISRVQLMVSMCHDDLRDGKGLCDLEMPHSFSFLCRLPFPPLLPINIVLLFLAEHRYSFPLLKI